MRTEFRFLDPIWYDILDSTNTHLAECVRREPATPHGLVVAAREQTAGRGRQQRRWLAGARRNLTFSFLWNAPVHEAFVPSMAHAISVGVAQFLESRGLHPAIKWPNDVLVGGKKICGILCERVVLGEPNQFAIVAGVGLNVNMDAAEATGIDQPATSLAIETGREHVVDDLLPGLLADLESPLRSWFSRGFAGIRDRYTHYAPTPGTPIRVRDGGSTSRGALAGFNDYGALILTAADGRDRVFYSGDVAE